MIIRTHSGKNFYPETLRKTWNIVRFQGNYIWLLWDIMLDLFFFFLYKFHIISGMFTSGYQANRFSGGETSLGFGGKVWTKRNESNP